MHGIGVEIQRQALAIFEDLVFGKRRDQFGTVVADT